MSDETSITYSIPIPPEPLQPCGHPVTALRWSRWPEKRDGVQVTHWCSMCEKGEDDGH